MSSSQALPNTTNASGCKRLPVRHCRPSTSGTIAITHLENGSSSDPVFSFGPDPVAPYYMTATIKVPASDGANGGLTHAIVLSDGALMRNENIGN